ncbi:MAG: Ribonuclease D [Candidatus Woesearchaeota archaeon]|nr:Ribonuclease D [Candidatus Woesearchaeota archaeon]
MNSYIYVDTQKKLEKACKDLETYTELGVDLECENHLHHYKVCIALIQVSSHDKNWLFDIIKLKDCTLLKKVLTNSSIQKIFHDVTFDFRILNYQFKIIPKNVFDTQVAAKILGKEELGLSSLLKEYFDIEKKEKFQRADWTKRPISKAMLNYAIKDTLYLIKLRNILIRELQKNNKWEWAQQEFEALENKEYEYHEPGFFDMSGIVGITTRQRAILKRLYEVRDKLAKKVNRPVYFIMNNKLMKKLALKPPKTKKQWKSLKRVHPIVKSRTHEFMAAVKKGKKEKVYLKKKKRKRFTPKQREVYLKLNDIRDELSTKLDIKKHIVMSKSQMQEIAATNKLDCLRDWQKKNLLKVVDNKLKNKLK